MKHLCALLFCSLLAVAPTVEAAPLTAATLAELMDLSGIDEQLEDFPASLRDAVVQGAQEQRVPPQQLARFTRIADETVMAHDFRGAMADALRAGVSEEDALALLDWFASPSGLKITEAEKAASTPAAQSEMRRRAQALMLSETRVEIARRMDAVIGSTEMVLQVQEQTLRAMIRTVSEQTGEPIDAEGIEKQLLGTRAARRAAAQQFVTASLVYTYNRIPVDELRSYLAVLETPEGRRFYDVTVASVAEGTEATMVAFAERVIGEAIRDAMN